MPRKTDGIEFEIHPRPTKGEDGKPLLYVRPAKGRKKSFKQLEDFCNKYRNLRTGELQMVFDVVIDVVGLWLSDGYRVETPIGSFAPKLKLLGEHTDPKTIHGRDIEYAGIEFIPSKEFIKEGGKNREGYRKSEAQVGNSQMYDEKAMDEALRRCMRLGYATIPEFMIFSGLKRDSAKAYLDSLCKGEHPRLWKVRESRRWLYFPKKNSTTEFGFDRPLQHIRAGAPRYKGARPNSCGRAFELRDMPSRSLLHAVSLPVCPYLFPWSYVLSSPKALCNSPENHKSVTFCPFPFDYWKYFHIFAPCFARDTRHSRLYIPNHHLGQKEPNSIKERRRTMRRRFNEWSGLW